MKYIIAANYLDRTSPLKWLVRREDQTSQEAIACLTVKANNVTFEESSGPERALGCVSIAVTYEEPTYTLTPPPTPAPASIFLPEGHEWHNPDEVPESKIPEGYRFAVVAEIDRKYHVGSMYWYDGQFLINESRSRDGANHLTGNTIVVPLSTPFPPVAPVSEVTKTSEVSGAVEVPVRYERGSFKASGRSLDGVAVLNLHADGSISAVL